jgi:F0F1-type ATP synthase assembly protein I
VAKPEPDDGLSDTARAQRDAAPYLAAMSRLVGAVVVGAGGGALLDHQLGWSPWGVVGGLGLGLVAGFWSLFRSLSQLGKRR